MIHLLLLFISLIIAQPVLADTFEAKYNTAQWIPVLMIDTDGFTARTALAAGSITFKYKEGDTGTYSTQALSSGGTCGSPADWQWCEDGDGFYRVYVPATGMDTSGRFYYRATATNAKPYWGILNVKTQWVWDESARFPASGTLSILTVTDNVGINWADISNPTTTQNLSGTSVLISDGTGAGQIDTLNGSIVNVDLVDMCTAVTDGVTLANDAITAAKIAAGAIGLSEIGSSSGTVTTGSCDPNTTLTFDTDMTQAGVNHWKDAFITFKDDTTTTELQGQTKVITSSAVNGCLTVRGGFTTAPASGDTFVIINK